jgi:elongation factor Ts
MAAQDVSLDLVKALRDRTGAGMMDCKKALQETDGDLDKAILWLRERGIAKAASRAGRVTGQGVVDSYLHRTGDFPPQIGAMVEVDCESDFVAKGDDFRKLARELAMHISASAPRWVSREDVPPEVVAEEREVYRRQAEQEGKPEQAIEKIVNGRLEKFFQESCLLEQPYIRDPKMPVKDLIAEHISKLQENIVVRRFARFNIKEG